MSKNAVLSFFDCQEPISASNCTDSRMIHMSVPAFGGIKTVAKNIDGKLPTSNTVKYCSKTSPEPWQLFLCACHHNAKSLSWDPWALLGSLPHKDQTKPFLAYELSEWLSVNGWHLGVQHPALKIHQNAFRTVCALCCPLLVGFKQFECLPLLGIKDDREEPKPSCYVETESTVVLTCIVEIPQFMSCQTHCLLHWIHLSPSFPQLPFSVPSVFSFS